MSGLVGRQIENGFAGGFATSFFIKMFLEMNGLDMNPTIFAALSQISKRVEFGLCIF
jgi:hypothetical protein